MRKHFCFAFVPFFSVATQLFSTPVTSSKIRPDGAPSFAGNPKRGWIVGQLNKVTHMRPIQISVRPMQNLPVTRRDKS